jgi:TP901-1 family phage major tail protein
MSQYGRELLIKIGDGADPEVFTTICGLTTQSIQINGEDIDVTTVDCTDPTGPLFRQTLGGIKSVTVSGNGTFKSKAVLTTVVNLALAKDNSANFEVIVPGFGTFAGNFRANTVGIGGEMEGAVTQELSLNSNGTVTFAAAA